MRSYPTAAKVASLDPALKRSSHSLLNNFDHKVDIIPNEIYVFDFDGVISSNFEDQIYRLEETARDVAMTAVAAKILGVRCDGMEYRYQRHLVYQAALWHNRSPILPGPGFFMAQEASRIAKLFVLTARSGWFAVERSMSFLKNNNIIPVEVFCVGRVGKVGQIKLLCDQFPNKIVTFIEDSEEHLNSVMSSGVEQVHPVLISEERSEHLSDEKLMKHYIETLEAIFSLPDINLELHQDRTNLALAG